MHGDIGNGRFEDDIDDDVDSSDDSDDLMLSDDGDDDDDNIGDMSIEINVEELVAKIERGEGDVAAHKREVRRRLEEIEEQRRAARELDSTYNFNFDDEF
jgi:hypothetical protein